MDLKSLDNMRDCVRQALLQGSCRGYEFEKMRHAIIIELKRLGYDFSEITDKLLEWNEICEKPLGVSEQRNQLIKYVDWVERKEHKRECKIGCKALEDYCIGKEKCIFYKKTTCQNRQEATELPFSLDELDKFLAERFKSKGYAMMLIVKALRIFQAEKAKGEIVYIGFKKISSVIRDTLGHRLTPMDIFRNMKRLIDEGVIEQVHKGQSGCFVWRKANGYRFLPWKPP